VPTRKPTSPSPSIKEASSTVSIVASSPTAKAADLCPGKENAAVGPTEEEFNDDADALEALLEAEKEKPSSTD